MQHDNTILTNGLTMTNTGHKGAINDLDDTLFPSSEYEKKAEMSSADALYNALSAVGIKIRYYEVLNGLNKIRAKDKNGERHFNKYCESIGLKPAPHSIVQTAVYAYHKTKHDSWVPRKETTNYLEFLVKNEFERAVVTSGDKRNQIDKLIMLDILKYLILLKEGKPTLKHSVYVCDYRGDPLIEKHKAVKKAIYDLGIDPEKSFILDDRPAPIVAGKMAGIKYGIRMLMPQGKYNNEKYTSGTSEQYREDFQVKDLYEVQRILIDLGLAKYPVGIKYKPK